ncbi:MAG: multicopper oxidase family protein [Alphaproteobacteria bacterium]|nr:multicopper oxidase family protein [Alphaproteobacteria bacterium]MBU1561225.1 multicopper oxidase family protein [Alphaproteobacteria bacterium]MBU2302887.1 multicopper oxidase family protein [Alphaproteobacteria bacterium]MBU2370321.1 multicopper oxidase family protein [Alphaproteobacteria bacterium]
MPILTNRRSFLMAGSALLAGACLPAATLAAAPVRTLEVGRRTIEVAGRSASVFRVTGDAGRSGLVLDAGERFHVELVNSLDEPTTVHWHGQVPRPELDGIAETGYVSPLSAGEARMFDFAARSGTHWMHSHHELQEQSLLTAPLIVRSAEDAALDLQEVVVLLNDFSFRSPQEILEDLTGGGGMDHGAMPDMDHGGMDMNSMDSMASIGNMDLNDVEYDAYLANDRTLEDPEVVRTERGGRVRLRIINGAASTAFWIDLGGHIASAIAVDGNPVTPMAGTRFPLAQAQRLDLVIDVPAGTTVPVFARREGDTKRTGIILAAPGAKVAKLGSSTAKTEAPLDLSFEQTLVAATPLSAKAVDARHSVMLTGSMSPYAWTMDDRAWGNRNPVEVAAGQRVELELMNHTMMAHPMHLHGHHFQVVGMNGKRLNGAVRDTVLVPAMGTVVIAFDADNPGRWLHHCHNLYHMATGMMSELVYV